MKLVRVGLAAAGVVFFGLGVLHGRAVFLALGVAFLAVGLAAGLLGRKDAASAPRRPSAPPMPSPPPEALADVPEPVTACPDCGFLGVRTPGIQDGVIPQVANLSGLVVCPRCGYRGLPLSFERRAHYAAYLAELNAARAP